ncbi:MAG TPA: A/G-specific adenine glycosylase [Bacteroidales bacterium]|nr:A/G-specific adenine glycosylase [Bacteroidales bacterium]HSA42116.1 A/G-specific adenine glycosylase [Bacteroidales bacterium]
MNQYPVDDILIWYRQHARALPWRDTKDPYLIWLSEVILQQTRVEQGLDYYLRFSSRFPDLRSLAEASPDEVMKQWQGLGYYSRARNLHAAARQVMQHYHGLLPESFHELLKIKGIGAYTAAAIASIAFRQAIPVVDGNVYRLVSRWLEIPYPASSATGRKLIFNYLKDIIPPDDPGSFNQALMELGALICIPNQPACIRCPVTGHCGAFRHGKQHAYPIKQNRKKPGERYFTYFFIVFCREGILYTIIKLRTGRDIWEGLWEFPLLEHTGTPFAPDPLPIPIPGFHAGKTLLISPVIKHQLTHQTIFANLQLSTGLIQDVKLIDQGFKIIELNELLKYPFSRLTERLLINQQIHNMLEKFRKNCSKI